MTLGQQLKHLLQFNMKKIIIVAVSDNWVIGKDNKMPWHIKEDLKYFKENTSGHPIIMGANTYKSIGKPLPNRTNIVVSHKYFDGVINVSSLEDAYKEAEKVDTQCFIIGGAQLYNLCINDADSLYITRVHGDFDGDTFFPEIDLNVWKLVSASDTKIDKESGIGYNFEIYKRK